MTELEIRNTPHWYILQYPLNRTSISTELQKVGMILESEAKEGKLKAHAESLSEGFRFYAPKFFNAEDGKQRMSRMESSVFQNYVFVYGSQEFIFHLKLTQMPTLNFFHSGRYNDANFPYVEQYVIDELKALEKKKQKIPYIPFVEEVAIGDTIRITEGEYEGFVATAIRNRRKRSSDIVLNVANWLVIPLCTLTHGGFEIIEYSKHSYRPYVPIDISKHRDTIIKGLMLRHRVESSDATETFVVKTKAQGILDAHKNTSFSLINMRCKHAAMMLYAAIICQGEKKAKHYKALVLSLLQNVTSDYDQALLYTALFGCYMDIDVFQKANAIVASWNYETCTKNKQLLLDDLKLFYEWYWKLKKKTIASRKVEQGHDPNEKRWYLLNAWNVKTRLLSILRCNKVKNFCPASKCVGFKENELEVLKDKIFVYVSYNSLLQLQQEYEEVKLVADRETPGLYLSFAKKTFESFKKICMTPADVKEIITSHDVMTMMKQCTLRTISEGPLEGVEGYVTTKKETQQSKVFVVLDNFLAVSITLTDN